MKKLLQKSDLEVGPLLGYYNFLNNKKEPYASVWRAVVSDIIGHRQNIESYGSICLLDTKSIKKRIKETIAKKKVLSADDRELLKRLNSQSINKTIAAGLLASGLEEGEQFLSQDKDFYRSLSAGKTKYHVRVNEENILKLKKAFK
jgi:hypothetical protein